MSLPPSYLRSPDREHGAAEAAGRKTTVRLTGHELNVLFHDHKGGRTLLLDHFVVPEEDALSLAAAFPFLVWFLSG